MVRVGYIDGIRGELSFTIDNQTALFRRGAGRVGGFDCAANYIPYLGDLSPQEVVDILKKWGYSAEDFLAEIRAASKKEKP